MSGPTYDLKTIQSYIRSGRYRVTLSAKQGAVALGMDTEDIETCVLGLNGEAVVISFKER